MSSWQAQREITDILAAADHRKIHSGYCAQAGLAPVQAIIAPGRRAANVKLCRASQELEIRWRSAVVGSYLPKILGNHDGTFMAGFLDLLIQRVGKPFVLILDNASVPTSKDIQPTLKVLKRQGLNLYLFPLSSAKLNRIKNCGKR